MKPERVEVSIIERGRGRLKKKKKRRGNKNDKNTQQRGAGRYASSDDDRLPFNVLVVSQHPHRTAAAQGRNTDNGSNESAKRDNWRRSAREWTRQGQLPDRGAEGRNLLLSHACCELYRVA